MVRAGAGRLIARQDADPPAAVAGREVHDPRALGEDRVVLAETNTLSGLEPRAALAHDDLAARHDLPGEHLDPKALGLRVAAVAAGSESLLMSHPRAPSCGP